MVSQNADNDFFSLSPAEQKELLDTALDVGTHTKYMELLKESRLGHVAISDMVGATVSTMEKTLKTLVQSNDDLQNDKIAALTEKIDGVAAVAAASSGIVHTGRLEPKEHYLAIVAETLDTSLNIDDLVFQLETLKRSRNKAASSVKTTRPLEYYVAQLESMPSKPDGYVARETVVYDEGEYEKLRSVFAASTKISDECGFDPGPYKVGCECCDQRLAAKEIRALGQEYVCQWTAKKEYMESCIAVLRTSLVRDLETKIQDAKVDAANKKDAMSMIESYDSIINARNVTGWMLERQRLSDDVETRKRLVEELDVWKAIKIKLDGRVTMFGTIFGIMDNFIGWLYTEAVLPRIAKCTSQVMALIDPALSLVATVGQDGFQWNLNNVVAAVAGAGKDKDKDIVVKTVNAPPMEKASGFQRFLCGLAVRIALGGIGAAGTKPKQLFLDEGFTSCDQTNLARVPDMLKTLLQLYDGIVLVTHLEELKDGGDAIIPITRNEVLGISTLRW